MPLALTLLNAATALLTGGAAVLGLTRPALLAPAGTVVSPGVAMYARMYAARALPLSAVTLAVLVGDVHDAVVPVLLIAGLAQVGDMIVAALQRNPGMLAGSTLSAVVPLGSVVWITTH
ncbi:hypothetical protein [Nocardia blacklockiae]|uniref:hypothetical protein n=1 Tax=Nocardia blacklockiae TaxID=480036 RepID=UPI001895FA77|nr:hypothetical protein [Nocardia blacklockiae]MBF6172079.1 hypothetical protein [Nocardia blacklockiae]